MSKKTNEVYNFLKEVDNLLSHHTKWKKGWFTSRDNKRYCLLGACNKVKAGASNIDTYTSATKYLSSVCIGFGGIAPFNDSPETKFKDVKRVIRQAMRACK